MMPFRYYATTNTIELAPWIKKYAISLEELGDDLKEQLTVVEDLKKSSLNNHTSLIKDSIFLSMLQLSKKNNDKNENQNDDTQISKYDENPNAMIPFTEEIDHFKDFLFDKNLILQLLAHMDIYVYTGKPNKATKMLISHKQKLKKSRNSPVALYNLLIEAYISISQLGKAFEIYRMLKVDNIQPNPQTYTLMFQMIASVEHYETKAEYTAQVMEDMNNMRISFDDLMNTSWTNAKQRDIVLGYIKSLDPKYCVQYKDIDVAYNCKLLCNIKMNSNYQSPAKGVVNMDELKDMLNTQIDMEKRCELEIKDIVPFTGDSNVRQKAIEKVEEWEKFSKSVVTEAFERNVFYLKQKEIRTKPNFKNLYPFLQVLPKEEYINAILCEIKKLTSTSDGKGVPMTILYIKLGRYIYMKYQFQRKMKAGIIDSTTQIYKKYLEWYMNPTGESVNGRIKWQHLFEEAHRSGICSEMKVPEWPCNVLMNVGKFLYNIIINDVTIPNPKEPKQRIPAFYLILRYQLFTLTEQITPHSNLHKLYKDSHPKTLSFETSLLPMCCPPRPWVDIDTGGYLFSKVPFMRYAYMLVLKDTPSKQLYPAFDSLNQLGSIPWRINVPMLDIVIQIFKDGGSEELGVPQKSSELPPQMSTEMDKEKISKLDFQLKRKEREMYALWCDCRYKLSIANHFKDKVFWLPHNVDFRGRAYPVPPHMTHLSSDMARSILMFAEGKPLGPDGLNWLKLHAINLTGMKKREPIWKRLEFANEVLYMIVDSARNPLTGEMWWTKSDDPWQTLAACKEIDNALRSPNVEEYVSYLPIHQDGSCNGLQHYAALGRDEIGAESVNLCPADTPQDVYSNVADMVEGYRKIDVKAGNPIAKELEGHISRKIVKQTVMTTVYGVTRYTARKQIAKQLSDLKEFNQNHIWYGSLYLVKKTFLSIEDMFENAKKIQEWFTRCAHVISRVCNQHVQWVTPLGLPIIQPYSLCTDIKKQKNAFPPNFIHSLDASHMMLTSIHCEKMGITFISVHDCFWTHPCTVNIMNRICREQFVALHSEPILENLSEFFYKKYEKYLVSSMLEETRENIPTSKRFNLETLRKMLKVFEEVPQKGDLDINEVLLSLYFFS